MPFIAGGEGRRYRGGEMVDDEWSYLMLPFWRERKGQHPFRKGKGARETTLGSRTVVCDDGQQPESSSVWIDPR
jgi:hypothetical protein